MAEIIGYNPASEKGFEEISRFAEHQELKINNAKFINFLKSQALQERSRKCGEFLEFKPYQHIQTAEIKRKLLKANFCKHRFCPMCSWRKSRRLVLEVISQFSQLEAQYGKLGYLFLTLTVPNPPLHDLHSTVKLMSRAWDKFIKYKQVKRAGSAKDGEMLGWVRGIELLGDETSGGEAHPHYHVLFAVPEWYFKNRKYLNHEKWRSLWIKAVGIDGVMVRVQRIKEKVRHGADGHEYTLSALHEACFEVLKYSAKPQVLEQLSDSDMKEILEQSRGLRQYARGGKIKNIEPQFDQLDPAVWKELKEEYYRWNGKFYQAYDPDAESAQLQRQFDKEFGL